jgi:hypothetical protein
MKNLFIDTNIWLSLYYFTKDDLSQFEKLQKMLDTSINLIVPQQVVDEIVRNREAKLSEALKNFNFKAPQYPVFCKGYEEFAQLSKDIAELENRFKKWKFQIDHDIESQKLPADKTIQAFMESISLIPCDGYIEKAYNRYRIGNPPGKDNKYGDAINLECLLDKVPDGEDLYFISADKDYRSLLSDKKMNPFLVSEWENKKHSNIFFYSNLVDFLNEHAKNIQLETENRKQELIDELYCSGSFQTTHSVIAMLNKYSGWTEQQIEKLCLALEDNTQVLWILEDTDVFEFYCSVLAAVKYNELDDCATKRAIDNMIAAQNNTEEARSDYEADRDEAFEEYYNH